MHEPRHFCSSKPLRSIVGQRASEFRYGFIVPLDVSGMVKGAHV